MQRTFHPTHQRCCIVYALFVLGFCSVFMAICFGIPQPAYAVETANNMAHFQHTRLLVRLMDGTDHFITQFYQAIMPQVAPIFRLAVVALLIMLLVGQLIGRGVSLEWWLQQLLIISLVNEFAFNSHYFISWIYEPMTQTIYDLATFILREGSGFDVRLTSLKGNHLNLVSGLDKIEEIYDTIILSGFKALEENNASLSGWALIFSENVMMSIYALIMTIAFFILKLCTTMIFAIGILGMHIMAALLPIALACYVFPAVKHVGGSIFRGFWSYGLILPVAAICLLLTVHLVHDVQTHLSRVIEESAQGGVYYGDLYILATVIAMLSAYLIMRVPDFAASITSGSMSSYSHMMSDMSAKLAGVGRFIPKKRLSPALGAGG